VRRWHDRQWQADIFSGDPPAVTDSLPQQHLARRRIVSLPWKASPIRKAG
jgi:hypothetical protein